MQVRGRGVCKKEGYSWLEKGMRGVLVSGWVVTTTKKRAGIEERVAWGDLVAGEGVRRLVWAGEGCGGGDPTGHRGEEKKARSSHPAPLFLLI